MSIIIRTVDDIIENVPDVVFNNIKKYIIASVSNNITLRQLTRILMTKDAFKTSRIEYELYKEKPYLTFEMGIPYHDTKLAFYYDKTLTIRSDFYGCAFLDAKKHFKQAILNCNIKLAKSRFLDKYEDYQLVNFFDLLYFVRKYYIYNAFKVSQNVHIYNSIYDMNNEKTVNGLSSKGIVYATIFLRFSKKGQYDRYWVDEEVFIPGIFNASGDLMFRKQKIDELIKPYYDLFKGYKGYKTF